MFKSIVLEIKRLQFVLTAIATIVETQTSILYSENYRGSRCARIRTSMTDDQIYPANISE